MSDFRDAVRRARGLDAAADPADVEAATPEPPEPAEPARACEARDDEDAG